MELVPGAMEKVAFAGLADTFPLAQPAANSRAGARIIERSLKCGRLVFIPTLFYPLRAAKKGSLPHRRRF
jgi:hypothetical protein